MFQTHAEQWADETFSRANLGDSRRTKRLIKFTPLHHLSSPFQILGMIVCPANRVLIHMCKLCFNPR
ncbi:transposase DNA-binding-containing protein [Xenorhabdus poinarii]|uniref:transposase DNA-binding-containing protein n=1 Tax=Xenorhabdus poinarii TaxID=40577 RepID=UPI0008FFA4F3